MATKNKGPIICAVMFSIVFLGLWLAIDLFVIPACWRCFFLFAGPLFLQIFSVLLFAGTLYSLFGWWKAAGGKLPSERRRSPEEEDEIQLTALNDEPDDTSVGRKSREYGDEEDVQDVDLAEAEPRIQSKPLSKSRVALLGSTIVLALLLFIVVIVYVAVFGSSLPPLDGEFTVHGVTSPVSITRDKHGVVHIEGMTDEDVVFGQAFAHCQDRLWQMEFQRRLGKGRLSEVLGEAAIGLDKTMLTLGLYRAANASVARMSPKTLTVLQAYVEGVNAYLNADLPVSVEFKILGFRPQPWTVPDVLVWGKIMFLQLSSNMFSEIRRYQWLTEKHISPERLFEISPFYPTDGATVIQAEDIAGTPFASPNPPPTREQLIAQYTIEAQRALEYHKQVTSKSTNGKRTPARSAKKHSEDESFSDKILADLLPFNTAAKRASNNWVISGSRTASGKPILANDPHLHLTARFPSLLNPAPVALPALFWLQAPSIWTLMHLKSQNLDVIGSSLVGVPGVIIGRNQHIAWGVTTVGTDVQDIFLIDQVDEKGYKHNGVYLEYEVIHEVIPVSNGSNVTLDLKKTIYGPVINHMSQLDGVPGVFALRWTALFPNDTTVEGVWDLNTATNFDEFRAALRKYTGPAQNFIYADVAGNIGYQLPAVTPLRAPGHSGLIPVPGNGSFDWAGFVPFDELLSVKNPKEGFIVSANNKVPPSNYKHFILNDMDWEFHYRAQRIRDMILDHEKKGTKITVEDVKHMQMDVKSHALPRLCPLPPLIPSSQPALRGFEAVYRPSCSQFASGDEVEASSAQLEWGDLDLEPGGPRLRELEVGQTVYDNPYYILQSLKNNTDRNCLPVGSCVNYSSEGFNAMVEYWGSDPGVAAMRTWGDEHVLITDHLVFGKTILACLFGRRAAVGGDEYTVNVAHSELEGPVYFQVADGPSYRHIVDLNNLDDSVFIHPMGQSGNVLSPHYDDLLHLWATGEYLAMQTTKIEADKHCSLVPKTVPKKSRALTGSTL